MSNQTAELVLSDRLIEDYISSIDRKGCTQESVQTYRSNLKRVCRYLPENKVINSNTLDAAWKQMEIDGISTSTVNITKICVNSFLDFTGYGDLRVPLQVADPVVRQVLSRDEYHSLLMAAKRNRDEQTYLLVKLFVCTGISAIDLGMVTAAAVRVGEVVIRVEEKGVSAIIIPHGLRCEMESYAMNHDIYWGPIFLNKHRDPIGRTLAGRSISRLSVTSGVQKEKCCIRCLQQLYKATMNDFKRTNPTQAEKLYNDLMNQEQQLYGWAVGI